MLQLDAARLPQQNADEVRHGAGSGRAIVRLVRVGFAPGQELGDVLHAVGHGGANAEAEVEDAGQRHRRHVGEGVVGQFLVDVRIDHQHRRGRLQDDAAVGRRALHRLDGDLATGAGLVLDDRRLGVGGALEALGDATAKRVGRAARREAGDDAHVLERLGALRARTAGEPEGGERGSGARGADEAAAVLVGHWFPPVCARTVAQICGRAKCGRRKITCHSGAGQRRPSSRRKGRSIAETSWCRGRTGRARARPNGSRCRRRSSGAYRKPATAPRRWHPSR